MEWASQRLQISIASRYHQSEKETYPADGESAEDSLYQLREDSEESFPIIHMLGWPSSPRLTMAKAVPMKISVRRIRTSWRRFRMIGLLG